MKNIEFHQPEFLLCEKSIQDYENDGELVSQKSDSLVGGYYIEDERTWVYHLKSESLIEFLYMNGREPQKFTSKHKDFVYKTENYTGFFVINKAKNLGQDEDIVLDKAWEFLKAKFHWEDTYFELEIE
ncbi:MULTISPECIES: hypothetical protein [Sphingobacterium]|uniref:hypothetical protein n=1 Tax=Sphingobacterium TaxID=28453 RepID=UPI00257E4120|nr:MULTISPECIES: hypothetical protein [Sphingobacterium]